MPARRIIARDRLNLRPIDDAARDGRHRLREHVWHLVAKGLRAVGYGSTAITGYPASPSGQPAGSPPAHGHNDRRGPSAAGGAT